ncbi:MAG: hypothetical protein ACD_2C00128G0001 [uncultured bacterium (gcode 4)]|uniref:Uncharacterized protein n=1 Tax=uncultured bacterium (gcode 4) TaxID=1234023 RepID=K2G3A7_9BACT|nr:MAG: hypothetical protein ACD_2C00128G0001 [uncultured bacterium (gcode 4)]
MFAKHASWSVDNVSFFCRDFLFKELMHIHFPYETDSLGILPFRIGQIYLFCNPAHFWLL